MTKVLLLDGNMKKGSLTELALENVLGYIHTEIDDAEVGFISLADIEVPLLTPGADVKEHDTMRRFHGIVEATDAFVIAFPEYNGSIPGSLKNLLDHISPLKFRNKPVCFIATAGSRYGGHGAIGHIRDIFNHMYARVLPCHTVVHKEDLIEKEVFNTILMGRFETMASYVAGETRLLGGDNT